MSERVVLLSMAWSRLGQAVEVEYVTVVIEFEEVEVLTGTGRESWASDEVEVTAIVWWGLETTETSVD